MEYYRISLDMPFSTYLKQKRKAADLSQEELADRVSARGYKVTAGAISNIERAYYKKQDGSESQPTKQFVITVAEVLGIDVNETLIEADYAPLRANGDRPVTAKDVFDILNRIPGFEGVLASEDITDENAQRILDDFLTVIELHKARKDR